MGNDHRSFAQGVLRTGLAMGDRNRFYAKQAQAAIDRNALYSQIGQSAQQIGGAFMASNEEQQRKAAAASLGGQLGLTPEVAQQIPVGTLAQQAMALQNRGYVSPQDQSEMDLRASQAKTNAAQEQYYLNGGSHQTSAAEIQAQQDAALLAVPGSRIGRVNTWEQITGKKVDPASAALLGNVSQSDYNGMLQQGRTLNTTGMRVDQSDRGIVSREKIATLNNESRQKIQQAQADLSTRLLASKNDAEKERLMLRLDQLDRAQNITEGNKTWRARLGFEQSTIGNVLRNPSFIDQGAMKRTFDNAYGGAGRLLGNPPGGQAQSAPAPAAPTGPTATGPNGEKVTWNGAEWVPAK